MPINPEIALQVRPPQFGNQLQNYGQLMQIQNAGNQNRLAEIQYRQAMRAEADNAALRQSLQGVDISTPEGLSAARNALLRVGNIKAAQELDKNALETTKTRGEIATGDITRKATTAKFVRDGLAGVSDQASYDAWRQSSTALGAQVAANAPPVFDPAFKAQNIATADEWLKRNVPTIGEKETARHNPVMEQAAATRATAAVEQAAAARGQVAATRENTQAQRGISNAATIRAEQDRYIKPLDELQQNISSTRQLLATGTPASDIQIQQQLTDMFDKSRATNMLFGANKNFGTLAGRVAGFVGRTFTGQYTDKQRSEIREMINDMERNVLTPTRSRIEQHYSGVSKAAGVNPELTRTPNFYSDSKSAAQAEADAFLKGK